MRDSKTLSEAQPWIIAAKKKRMSKRNETEGKNRQEPETQRGGTSRMLMGPINFELW